MKVKAQLMQGAHANLKLATAKASVLHVALSNYVREPNQDNRYDILRLYVVTVDLLGEAKKAIEEYLSHGHDSYWVDLLDLRDKIRGDLGLYMLFALKAGEDSDVDLDRRVNIAYDLSIKWKEYVATVQAALSWHL